MNGNLELKADLESIKDDYYEVSWAMLRSKEGFFPLYRTWSSNPCSMHWNFTPHKCSIVSATYVGPLIKCHRSSRTLFFSCLKNYLFLKVLFNNEPILIRNSIPIVGVSYQIFHIKWIKTLNDSWNLNETAEAVNK